MLSHQVKANIQRHNADINTSNSDNSLVSVIVSMLFYTLSIGSVHEVSPVYKSSTGKTSCQREKNNKRKERNGVNKVSTCSLK